jgi:hypothetical protein
MAMSLSMAFQHGNLFASGQSAKLDFRLGMNNNLPGHPQLTSNYEYR